LWLSVYYAIAVPRRSRRRWAYAQTASWQTVLMPDRVRPWRTVTPGDGFGQGKLARILARLDPGIPYALLAFHPSFEMTDPGSTTRQQAPRCLEAAQAAGLTRVRIGNRHLLR
jgi:hypothetical protein